MSTDLAKIPLNALVKRPDIQARFQEVLGRRGPQFIASILSVGRSMPDVDPLSIISSAMTAASLDLPIDKNLGQAWLVPYRDGGRKLAQFQMGYRGYIQLALRSSKYERMNAEAVNKEVFTGYDDVGEPILDWNQYDPTKPVAGYAFAFKTVNGFLKKVYWIRARVEAHAQQYSQAYRSGKDTPWKSHFDQMALKTVVMNTLRQWGILSVEMQMAFTKDESVSKDLDADVEIIDNQITDESVKDAAPVRPVALTPKQAAKYEKDSSDEVPFDMAEPENPKTATPDPSKDISPQDQLAAIIIDNGFKFKDFLEWGFKSGNITNPDDITGFDTVPTAMARRFAKAQKGLIDGIKKHRNSLSAGEGELIPA